MVDLREELLVPALPAGFIVEERDDGSALRDDGVVLKPADQNPWYVLMTIAGEAGHGHILDVELAEKNMRIWNSWCLANFSFDKVEMLQAKIGRDIKKYSVSAYEHPDNLEQIFSDRLPGVQMPSIYDPIDLRNTRFPNTISFSEMAFFSDILFTRSQFDSLSWFHSTYFGGNAYFQGAAFEHWAYFEGARFESWASFLNARFANGVNFNDVCFTSTTSFRGVNFKNEVPTFFQTPLHQDSEFGTKPALWPKTSRMSATNLEGAKRGYTRLAQAMSELDKPDDEQFFRRQEMGCKRRLGNWLDWLFLSLYAIVSDYGHSVGRPMFFLALTVLAGAVAFSWDALKVASNTAEMWNAYLDHVGPSFSSTLAFLGFLRRFHPDFFISNPWWFETVSGAQTILGVVFLFFLGLGLRNRFRLK